MRKCKSYIFGGLLLSVALACGVMAAERPTKPTSAPAQTDSEKRPKMLWDYQKELEISDNQMAGIKEAITEFEGNLAEMRSKLQTVELDLQDLIDKKADVNLIKKKLSESAILQIEIRLAEILTSRKIDSMLSPTQMKMWKEIRAKEKAKKTSKPPAEAP